MALADRSGVSLLEHRSPIYIDKLTFWPKLHFFVVIRRVHSGGSSSLGMLLLFTSKVSKNWQRDIRLF